MAIPPSLIQKKFVNGRWVLWFNGREAFLAGKYADTLDSSGKPHLEVQSLDGWQGDGSRADKADFVPRMKALSSQTNNFFRHWVTFYALFVNGDAKDAFGAHCKENHPERSFTRAGEPWAKRYSPFMYVDDEAKTDLFRYNDDYFFRLRRMIETALDYGIIVQITIFDRTGLSLLDCSRWPYNPWNAHHNINEAISTKDDNSEPGVDKFYQRDIPAKFRMPKIPHPRPGDDDIIEPDPDDYVIKPTTLGALQDKYARKVVNETVKYPNVVYEIMNEPFGGGQTKEDNLPMRVKWNDTMLGVIYEITQGKRLIFYNELQPGDIAAWKHSTDVTKSTLNYHHLDGVTFHVDARNFDPKTRLTSDLLSELVVQVSTDTVDEHLREDGPYNQAATTHAFANHMMFQAEALSNAAAQGIGSASPPPTLFNLPDFIGRWWKLPEWSTPNFFPHLAHVVNDDATIVDLNQDTDQFTMQGRVVSIGPGTLTSFNQLSGKLATFDIEFPEPERMQPPVPLPNVTLLQFFRDNIVQVFRKLEPARDLLYPFYFKWERISVVPADSPIQPFYMFIYPDRKLVTHNKADFVKNSDAIIKEISPDQIVIFNNTNQKRNVWNYTFSNQNQQLTIVRVLVNKDDTPLTQTFRRLL